MDLATAIRIYAATYLAAATQMATDRMAGAWMWTMGAGDFTATSRQELVAHARQSARWASHGYMPGEAAPLIAAGVTPERAAEMDQIATDVAGGPDEHTAQWVDRMVADGTLIDPARVRQEQDPDDPYHTIITILPE